MSAQMNPFLFRGHSYKYEEFRKQNYFVDCQFHDSRATYRAHKIVLAFYSTLLRNYFIKHPISASGVLSVYDLPIPFNSEMFNDLVNFFYRNQLVIDKVDSSKLLPWLSMGYVYDVKPVREIIEPIIRDRFLLEPKDDDLDIILNFSEYYKKVRLNTNVAKDFDNIDKNLQDFIESQKLFVTYLGDRFEKFENERKKLSKLTPFLLSEILKSKEDYDDIRKARILENYVKVLSLLKEHLTVDDRRILQSVIDWDKKDAYKLFTYNNLDWILPEVARPQIAKLIQSRRDTLKTFESDPALQEKQPINHWYAISCVNKIETAHETESLHETDDYSITHFIGTLGNSNRVSYVNPKKHHFLNTNFYDTMSKTMHFDDEVAFDEGPFDPKRYYLSKCVDLTNKNLPSPYIGFNLPGTSLLINKIVLTSVCERITDRPQKMTLFFDNKPVGTSSINDDKIEFTLSPPKVAKDIRVGFEPLNIQTKSYYFALRVHRLEAFGGFLPSSQ